MHVVNYIQKLHRKWPCLILLGVLILFSVNYFILKDGVLLSQNFPLNNESDFPGTFSKNIPNKFVKVFKSLELRGISKARLSCGVKLIPIFVYFNLDKISRSILFKNTWNEKKIQSIVKFAEDLDFHFIDIGCGIGTFTLSMACRGYDVIAVDANIYSLKRLAYSIKVNNFEKNVVVLHNVISDSYFIYGLKVENENFGGVKLTKLKKYESNSVRGIRFDDVIPFLKHKNVVIKISIDGGEIEAFRKAKNLFANFNVLAVFMDWSIISKSHKSQEIIKLFRSHHLYPFTLAGDKLEIFFGAQWPADIVWKF